MSVRPARAGAGEAAARSSPAGNERPDELAAERIARADAESATRARDQFLSIVSHELRSPLNAIKSWTHVLENLLHDAPPPVRRALAGIMLGVEQQVHLIDELLDLTRALSGNLALAKQPMALLPALAEAVESARAGAGEAGVAIEADYGIADEEILGDPERVRQIFAGLIGNAVKFARRDGTIRIRAWAEDAGARIEVRDDGAGIAPELLACVFDPFRQADPDATRRGHAGLGLGLPLVQRLAEAHGGFVTCESEGVGCGATFRVSLPLRRDTGPRVVPAMPSEPGTASAPLPSLAGIRVLVIDDQREARESLGMLLTQAGARVALAASGHEALAYLALDGEDPGPEVIVCDIAMPEEDGYATLARIRRWESSRAARGCRPAIAVSAFSQREDRLRAIAGGFHAHLGKPVAAAELVVLIATLARPARA